MARAILALPGCPFCRWIPSVDRSRGPALGHLRRRALEPVQRESGGSRSGDDPRAGKVQDDGVIIALEGPSAAGKTTWCRRHASDFVGEYALPRRSLMEQILISRLRTGSRSTLIAGGRPLLWRPGLVPQSVTATLSSCTTAGVWAELALLRGRGSGTSTHKRAMPSLAEASASPTWSGSLIQRRPSCRRNATRTPLVGAVGNARKRGRCDGHWKPPARK